jgi:hypothetical protein
MTASTIRWLPIVCLAVAVAGGTVVPRDAVASVSIAVPLEDLVRGSDAVATVTPVEQRATWEDGRIFTYTRVRVDRAIAGDVPQGLWIRTMGGVVGRVGQIVEGEPSFATGQTSLVFLRQKPDALEVVGRAQGQFALVSGDDGAPRLVAASNVGMVLKGAASPPRPMARDVLHERPLAEAVNVIAAAWAARVRIRPEASKVSETRP